MSEQGILEERAADAGLVPPIVELHPIRFDCATRAYSVRRVPAEAMRCLRCDLAPGAGDVVLARVERIGQHKRLHTAEGGRRELFPGDLVLVAYANRYAPSQFEAHVPRDLEACDLAAGGGIAARVVRRHARMRAPTRLHPLGLVTSDPDGPPLNVAGFALAPPVSRPPIAAPVLAVVGTSMDAGKTATAAHLVRGLRDHGQRVGYAKVTGTAAGGDPGLVRDAGAHVVLDFTDVGYASTYRIPPRAVEAVFEDLLLHLDGAGVDAIVVEVADGLLQRETRALLESVAFRSRIDGLIFASADSVGAVGGVRWLMDRGLPVTALSGRIMTSPLQVQEAAIATRLPLYDLDHLRDPATATKLIARRSGCGAAA